ncbi:aminoglycoside phosphotransferase [Dictyobacter sp. S3.2.2.5]|uniref:Aminoglycoside phosphotransferase n=2 Tax=Dictyobacter halimunensis TaxID=3026934 RepID=A0ABQ6G326_9CHLR|nr:aminoglycoside phosphotransferase [Dictyobacter sp. S3.2.2.5]
MESKTKNRKTREQVARMAEKAFGGTTLAVGEDAVRELKEGWFNAAYDVRLSDGREVILKIAPLRDVEVLAYEKNIMETEVASMRLVRENPTIPVPEIYFFDTDLDVCDADYYFMEKLSGDNYEHVKASLAPELQAQIDQQIGVIIREINGFTGTYFGYDGNSDLRGASWKEAFIKIMDAVLADGARKDADFGYPIDEIRATILKHAPSLEAVTTPRLVHWDAWDLNFFVKDGKISGILDFERALWADPLIEAQFRALDLSGGVSESMRGYGKTTFTHEEDARCHLYTLHLGLVMKTECYYRNYDSDFASDMAKQLMVPAMNWLKEN